MPPTPLVNLDAPTATDVAAAHNGVFRAAIGPLGTAPPDHPIRDVYGAQLPTDQLFVFPMECSNQGLDTYFTHMDGRSIANFAADSARGTALMLGHGGAGGEQPVGYSYAGTVLDEPAGPYQARVADTAIQYGPTFARSLEQFYIVRGLSLAGRPNDAVIRGIETRTTRDGSVTFIADTMTCDLCGLGLFGGCAHIPGVRYPAQGRLVRATVENGNAHKVETSLVYAGATPETGVVPVKARLVAAAQRLTPQEATDLQALEARYGQRMIDPAHYARVTRYATPPRKETPMAPRPAARADSTAPPVSGAPAPNTPTHTDLLTTVSTEASATAQALADQITALQQEITNADTVIQANTDLITALGNTQDSQGNPIDTTDQIAAAQAEVTALQADQDARQATLTALQAQLAAVNGTAAATGGTAVPAPAADASAPAPAQMHAALGQMRQMTARYLSPLRVQVRTLDAASLQPIIAGLSQFIQELQDLMTAAGTPPPVSLSVRTVLDVLHSAGVPRGAGQYAAVRTLVRDAADGRVYRQRLTDEAVRGKRRVLGDGAVDEPATRAMLAGLPVPALEAEVAGYGTAARHIFTPGRAIWPGESTARDPAPIDPDDHGTLLTAPSAAGRRA